jgi:hypothetical protein
MKIETRYGGKLPAGLIFFVKFVHRKKKLTGVEVF